MNKRKCLLAIYRPYEHDQSTVRYDLIFEDGHIERDEASYFGLLTEKLYDFILMQEAYIGKISFLNVKEIHRHNVTLADWNCAGRLASDRIKTWESKLSLSDTHFTESKDGEAITGIYLEQSKVKALTVPDSLFYVRIGKGWDDLERLKLGKYTVCMTAEFGAKLVYADLGDSLYRIEYGTFNNAVNLKQVKFSRALNSIADYAFAECASLEELDFSRCAHLKIIPKLIKCADNSLKKLVLPPHLEDIHFMPFGSISNLREIYIKEGTPIELLFSLDNRAEYYIKSGKCKVLNY